MNIDPSSIISPKANIHATVEIGPFCIIGDNVEIEVTRSRILVGKSLHESC